MRQNGLHSTNIPHHSTNIPPMLVEWCGMLVECCGVLVDCWWNVVECFAECLRVPRLHRESSLVPQLRAYLVGRSGLPVAQKVSGQPDSSWRALAVRSVAVSKGTTVYVQPQRCMGGIYYRFKTPSEGCVLGGCAVPWLWFNCRGQRQLYATQTLIVYESLF